MVMDAAMGQRFHNAQVGVGQLHILAHQADGGLLLGGELALHHGAPLGQVAGGVRDAQQAADQFVQPFLVEQQRHFINGAGVQVLDHPIRGQVAEQADLGPQVPGNLVLGAAHQDVRGNADAAQLLHAVLGGLGLELAGGLEVGHQGHVDVQAVFVAHFRPHLPDGFQEGLALNVAHRAADLGNDHVRRVLRAGHG